jgi:CheY-like chemotaxis protein
MQMTPPGVAMAPFGGMLPVSAIHSATGENRPRESACSRLAPVLRSVGAMRKRDRILVVEDNFESREMIVNALLNAGYAVAKAADGTEAIYIAARWPPDLLLSDLRLLGMNGAELARRLHAFAPDLPVVLTTGLEETHDVGASAPEYGTVTCLRNPKNLGDLLWTIAHALAEHRRFERRCDDERQASAMQVARIAGAARPTSKDVLPNGDLLDC